MDREVVKELHCNPITQWVSKSQRLVYNVAKQWEAYGSRALVTILSDDCHEHWPQYDENGKTLPK